MSIIAGYFSIAFAFVLLASMFLWFFIKGNAHILLKLIVIPVLIWYTLALYYAPNNLMGWPTPEEPPNVARVINGIVKKPVNGQGGALYLWMISLDKEIDYKKKLSDLVNPKNVFDYNSKNVPRAYRLPYDKDLDRQLTKGKQARRDDLGIVIVFKRKGKDKLKVKTKIEIHNLRDAMKKTEKNVNSGENRDFIDEEASRLQRMGNG